MPEDLYASSGPGMMDNFSVVYLWLVFLAFVSMTLFSISALMIWAGGNNAESSLSSGKNRNIISFGGEFIDKKDFLSKSAKYVRELRESDNQPAMCCGEFTGSYFPARVSPPASPERFVSANAEADSVPRGDNASKTDNGLYRTSAENNMAVYDVEYNKYAAVIRPNVALRTGDELARRDFLKEKKISCNFISESFEEIARMLARERGGKKFTRVSLTNRDAFWAMINEKADTMYFNAGCLKRKAMLEYFIIPHEVYHSMIMTDRPGAEEILAYALSFIRVVNVGRMKYPGRKSPGMYNRVLAEIKEMEAASAKKSGEEESPLFSSAIAEMAKYVSHVESTDAALSDEKMVEISVYYAVKMFKNSVDRLNAYHYVRDFISDRSESEINAEVMKLWSKKKVL
ncbi:MAG: hypothetical protein ACD_47C00256G0003 [uncultured bacterium]|nr:MAG: hypothetical protein ACD_47C00256G0003 [uncultured bacterium]